MRPILTAFTLCFIFTLGGCQSAPRPVPLTEAQPVDGLEEEFNNISRADGFYFAGYPTVEGLEAMQRRGVTTIVSLKRPEQVDEAMDASQREVADRLGMTMVYLPISPESFSEEDVNRLDDLIEQNRGPMLIHCGSSNTVGGLWASYLHRKRGVEYDRAMELGKSAGLRAESMIEATERVSKGRLSEGVDIR